MVSSTSASTTFRTASTATARTVRPSSTADLKHHNIDKHFAGYFKYLIEQLKSYTTPTGTLLDEGVSIWLNDLSSGPPHGSDNLPYVLAGVPAVS